MSTIDVVIFPKPSANVRGVVTAFMAITKKKGKGTKVEDVRVAHATLFTDQAPSTSLSVPSSVVADEIPALATALNDFHTKVIELDKERVQ